jgi:hypothetical protein
VSAAARTEQPRGWRRRRLAALRGAARVSAFAVLPALLTGFLVVHGLQVDLLAVDFSSAFLDAGERIRAGLSPYPELDDPRFLAGLAFVYPPLTALAALPFTVLPVTAAEILVTVLLVAVVVATLWVLDVRDWRCYGVAFIWFPVFSAVQTANLTLPLGLGAALAWRYRDRIAAVACSNGVMLAAKLFFWPLLVWQVATRRGRAAAWSLAVAALVTLVTWGALGFVDVERYPSLLRKLSELESPESYTPYALALDLGAGRAGGRLLGLAVALALIVAVAVSGRRGNDRRSFVLAVAASIVCSPIVWLHYFALLLVPVAVTSRRLSPAWFLPVALWAGSGNFNGATWQTVLVLVVAALTVGLCAGP